MTSDSLDYDTIKSAQTIFEGLVKDLKLPLPVDARELSANVKFTLPPTDYPIIVPCPLKQCETIAALKALEGTVANAVGKLRFGIEQTVEIDLQHATLFLFMAYLATINGYGKYETKMLKDRLVDTDLLQAQSNLYRRLSANLYKTKDEKYFHIHGSLEATTTLNMIGLPGHDETQTEYRQSLKTIGDAVAKFTAEELETMNEKLRQAGTTCYTREEFLKTPHGKTISSEPYWSSKTLESESPVVPFKPTTTEPKQILSGFKVVELCRIIAGPTITRILAEYGAQVIKVTSANLSDVPFFQVDGNVGKHTTNINLKTPEGRKIFEDLIEDADIIVDGYRTNAFTKLGFGPEYFAEKGKTRGKGYIYVSENCYGFEGEWAHRPGWQQIADCVSGVAYIQGEGLGRPGEPIIPPFPMSDYGTGCMGAIAALDCVYKRATQGGSYWAQTSLVQYDLLLMEQGTYPPEVWSKLLSDHDDAVKSVRYYDSVDHISGAALKSIKKLKPDLLDDKYMDEMLSEPYKNGIVRTLKPVVKMNVTANKFNEPSRPNGYDKPCWW